MKALFYSIIVLLFTISLSSQTILKPLPLSSYSYGGHTINFDDTTVWAPRVQKHFMLGWQWAGPNRKTNERLHCNFYQSFYGLNNDSRNYFAHIPDSGDIKYIVWQHLQTPGGKPDFRVIGNQMGIQFDPTAWTTINNQHPIRAGDTTGAVFGFKVRDSVYGHLNNSGANFDRYSLDTLSAGFTDSMKYAGVIVLNQPVIDNRYYQYDDASTSNDAYRQLGRWWYVSINMRRTDSTDTLMNNDTLLTISLPTSVYTQLTDSTYTIDSGVFIIFDSIALDTVGLATSLPHSRGIVMPLKSVTGVTKKLAITRMMLPKGNATDRDITISAFFRFKSKASTTPPNPWLTGGGMTKFVPRVINIGITAFYHGRGNVSIDWIRIGTPELESELRGEKDSIIWSYAYHNIQIMRDTIAGDTIHAARNKFRLLSFYASDEPYPERYFSMRYYNTLFDGRITSEGPSFEIARVSMQYDNWWSGGMGGLTVPFTPTPVIKIGNPDLKYHWHYKTGWDFKIYTAPGSYWNPDGSNYETRLDSKAIKRSDASLTNYFKNYDPVTSFDSYNSNPGSLGAYELTAYYCNKESSFFYSGKPWWCQNWGTAGFKMTNFQSGEYADFQVSGKKPLTGEEMRLQIWTPLILGAKGLTYDRMYSDVIQPTSLTNGSSRDNFQTGMMYAREQIPDSLEGTSLINSDAAGPDFIRSGDSTRLDFCINMALVANYTQVPVDRVYLGRKSMRREVMKAHDFIYNHDQLLMSMRLVSWFGKGFYFYQTGDTTMFSRYLISDPDQYKVRPPTRTYYDSIVGKTLPFYEDPDSTFFDLTIHKVGTTPLDSSFILCALNRRTAPFLLEHDSISGKDTIIRFVTTAEFDSIVAGNPSKKYAQSGAREITIPFNYHDSLGYALLRIKELGGGIDTVIGQDRSLAIKFLPGEGKMFKVEILHPDTTLSGILSYTNQRKLVGFPKKGNSDSMYYHLTYHKPIPGTSRSGVYYRRSEAIRTNSSTQNIIWQKEILVSKSIRLRKGQNDTIASSNCAYPALVVRYDSSSLTNKVFVVYSCEDEDTCFYSKRKRIVETILPADDSSQTFNWPQKAETLSTFYGSLDEYGTPMINASDGGNYYCWADSLLGIVAGWKHPDSTYLEDSKNISYRISIGEIPKACQHPSLNSYSRLKLGENDCALVWQEKFDTDGDYAAQNRILYTRLKMVNGNLTSYLPPTLTSANGVHVISSPGDIAWLSDAGGFYSSHYIPSVYREVLDTAISPSQQLDFRSDCVAWHTTTINESGPSIDYTLSRRILIIHDTTGVPNTWWSEGLTEIWSTTSNLYNISQSQGEISLQFIGSYIGNGSSRSHIMTFTETPKSGYGILPNHLMQIQSGLLLAPTLMGLSTLMTNDNAFTIDYVGKNGQTAALPRMISEVDWRKNRRVYEGASVGSLRRIQASAMLFMKQGEEVEPTAFTGFGDRSSKFMLSNPMLNGKMLTLERVKRLRGEAGNFGSRHGFTDTLETNWFTVGDEANLMLKSIGKNAGLVSAFVERRSDGERFAVQLRTSDDTTALWTRIPLLRGGVEEYRFFMVKNTERNGEVLPNIPNYGEEIILGGLKTRISANKGNGDIQAIDLGRDAGVQASIRVYPNPAQDKVSVVVLGTNPKDVWHIKVMNVLGHVMSEHEDKTSSLLEIVTEDYPSGVYYITAESGRLNATTRFVIMK
ncbi:MAG: T9SS type A sorting domain-containing protein [Candidatus Kapaibacterium sp.]